MIRTLLTISALTLASSAWAAPEVPAPNPPEPMTNPSTTADATGADQDPEKVICRTVRPPTGTRVTSGRTRQRICQTRAQWDDQAREAQEGLREVRDRGVCSGGAANCKGD
ncbi:MAG: hypothetical protein K1X35_03365 [Caulobacteraceae bacterium]|nr:hypothetical protein [Caulobacteraceae bacterium]